MTGYLINFLIYTLAMVGLIFFALFVYKKFSTIKICSKKINILSVVDVLNVAPRKCFYIIKAGEEKFLVASDIEKISLISKLETESTQQKSRTINIESYQELLKK